ncbi:MAG: hypothetical protein PHR00_02240 [Patescibacteria group bacterium]|nr:hypothetical protein [Patescibacteria group bacterium]
MRLMQFLTKYSGVQGLDVLETANPADGVKVSNEEIFKSIDPNLDYLCTTPDSINEFMKKCSQCIIAPLPTFFLVKNTYSWIKGKYLIARATLTGARIPDIIYRALDSDCIFPESSGGRRIVVPTF